MSPEVLLVFPDGTEKNLPDTDHRTADFTSEGSLAASQFLCGDTGQCLRNIYQGSIEIKEVANRSGRPCPKGFHRGVYLINILTELPKINP